MKKQKLLQTGKLFLVLLLLLNGSLFSQTWNNVAFSNYYNVDATIDNSDNIYSLADSNTAETRVVKYNSMDAQAWAINISSHLIMSNYNSAHIATNNTKVFAGGYSTSGGGAKIIQMDNSNGGNISNWELLGSTIPSYNEIRDIKIVGNEMYVLGHFNGTLTYNNGANSLVTNTMRSMYLIKYTVAPKAVLWVKKVNCTGGFEASSLDVDASGSIFVTGFYKGTITFNDGSTDFNFTNNTTSDAAFLAKLTSAGNYDSAFGLKQFFNGSSNLAGSKFAVNANGLNNTVYFSVLEKVFAFSKIGSGPNLWTRSFPISRKVAAIGVNKCGDVYVSGMDLNSQKTICSGDFFADMLNKNNGTTVWSSVSTSCHSIGNNLLFNSTNKLKSVGGYKSQSSDVIVIDNQFTTNLSYGSFIGTFDDQPVNSCCDITISLPASISMCGTFSALCGPTPPAGSTYTYQWWGPSPSNNNSVLLGTSQCFTPTQHGNYLLKVTNQFGCTVSQTVNVLSSIPAPQLGNDIVICKGDVLPIISIANQGFESGQYTIKWYINGVLVQTGGVTLQVSPSASSTVSVVISKPGCPSVSDGIKITIKNCGPTACFVLKNILSEANEDSKYGPQPVKKLCKERVEIDGSCSENETGYHLRIAEFDLMSWNFIQDYYSGWVNGTAQAPATINLNTLIGTASPETGGVSRTFLTNKLYVVCLSVGPVWNSAPPQFFRVVSCAKGEPEFVKVDAQDLESNVFSSLEIFPNPTNGKVTIGLNGMHAEEISVYNSLGETVYKAKITENVPSAGIDLSGLPSGIYIAHIKTYDGQAAVRKIIKN
ncbi:T9SS type A sorting domain-containing protein [Flavobacterium humi]|uniref:T9SS type A sorting domain-containing protein n=1 Tax=Flavobacterium humi TaxID=2562683 RepID=A0A4Z0LAA7_9FLAO|nr:T9SS type A sorting domain-containing protein [Flavobacterium humi]TGD58852.1 T9SS type A sorting domain-containing protein [Flavobacterium humi]